MPLVAFNFKTYILQFTLTINLGPLAIIDMHYRQKSAS